MPYSIRHVNGSPIPDIFLGDRKVATVWPAGEGLDPEAEEAARLIVRALNAAEP